MDLLCSAYSNTSDDDGGDGDRDGPTRSILPPPKRIKPESSYPSFTPYNPVHIRNPTRPLPNEAPIPGRYISKRERAALTSASSRDPNSYLNTTPPVLESLADSNLPNHILLKLRNQNKCNTRSFAIAERSSIILNGHTSTVNTIQWSNNHPHLLASAGMDHTVNIYNVWSKGPKKARSLKFHSAAVKDVKWAPHGSSILSCGFDSTSRLIDIEKNIQTQILPEDQIVNVVKYHPNNSNLYVSGGSNGLLRLWDLRTGKPVHEYGPNLGPILDVEFIADGKQLISSSDQSGNNVSEKAIVVWDISRQLPLSNQVYTEAYTCPSIKSHPFEPYFVAQSNGNYIAIFSTKPPFKLDKYKRYEGHGVSGFPIKCNFSLDGRVIASGSSDGCVYFYESKSGKIMRKIKVFEQACVDVAFHPTMCNVIGLCSWNGEVKVFE